METSKIRIAEVRKITEAVTFGDGKEFVLCSIYLSGFNKDLEGLGYKQKMFGTLDKNKIQDLPTGRVCLADFAADTTIAGALKRREEQRKIAILLQGRC